MLDRYTLEILQTTDGSNNPQFVKGDLTIVIAALHEYTKYPRHDLISITVKRDN